MAKPFCDPARQSAGALGTDAFRRDDARKPDPERPDLLGRLACQLRGPYFVALRQEAGLLH